MNHFAVSVDEMRKIEQEAFRRDVPPILVMENAARNLVKVLWKALENKEDKRVLFVCGPGNNGGDGLAAARIFSQQGGKSQVFLVKPPKTENAQQNLKYLEFLSVPVLKELPDAKNFDVLVDAVFGIGLTRAPAGVYAEVIQWMNEAKKTIVSVDVPSGMDADTGEVYEPCVRADFTCTFHAAKKGLLISPEREVCGQIFVESIGLLPTQIGIPYYKEESLEKLLPSRICTAHKGMCGRVLIYAGSEGKTGAAAMCALAALKAGAGLVTIVCDRSLFPVLQTQLPNAMCTTPEEAMNMKWDVLAAGCGIGVNEEARNHLIGLLQKTQTAVLDADALNLLAEKEFALPANTVLTPHMLEGARLLKTSLQDMLKNPLENAGKLSEKFNCTVILKSSVSVISQGKWKALNVEGSPALSKGGSGDALCGILAATLCEQKDLFEGSRLACLRMGAAGKKAGEKLGVRQVLTGEMLQFLK